MNTLGGPFGLMLYDVMLKRKYIKSAKLDLIIDVFMLPVYFFLAEAEIATFFGSGNGVRGTLTCKTPSFR